MSEKQCSLPCEGQFSDFVRGVAFCNDRMLKTNGGAPDERNNRKTA